MISLIIMNESDEMNGVIEGRKERRFPRPSNNPGVRAVSDVESSVMPNNSSNVKIRIMNECDSVLSVVLHP